MYYTPEAASILLFKTTGIIEPPENCAGLTACLNEALAQAGRRIVALERIATGEIAHLHQGSCPDAVEGFDSRDPACPACQVLLESMRPPDND